MTPTVWLVLLVALGLLSLGAMYAFVHFCDRL